ncbi:MAG: zf-TFIIB domain-containing protein [Pyrinomonadaceae bacterium]
MSEIFDERRKALENEYIRRKDRETLDKLREQLAAEAAAKGLAGGRQCPLGHGALTEETKGSIVIDRCGQCGGVWLDKNELEQLTSDARSGGWIDNVMKSFSNE